ncbi:MAG: cysteine hydrolase [Acidimicrobiaceae bacterium]|nr:cysteine hydrolase [Acidimicrobiaceae bacterium]
MPAIASANPYPWPYHGTLDPRRTALVACLDGRWRAERPESEGSDARLVRLAAALEARGGLVVAVTATTSSRAARRAVHAGTRDVVEPVSAGPSPRDPPPAGLGAHVVLEAGATDGFYASGLDDVLRERGCTDLVLAGWGLEGPVHSTMRSANDRGYECLLVADASTSLDPMLAFAACEMVRFSGGIFGAFADTADVVAALNGGLAARSTS